MAAHPGRPTVDPSSTALGVTVDRLRAELPAGVLVAGAAVENHDLERALSAKTPLVIGVVLGLGFLLLLIALQATLVAALGVLTNLLAVGAAFGIARLVFQDGHGADLFGFESQHYLDAWAPVFFTFALSGPLPPKEMGVVLGVAVLLDAVLVRLLLLPVVLRIAGRAARACPGWLRRVLPTVRFSHQSQV